MVNWLANALTLIREKCFYQKYTLAYNYKFTFFICLLENVTQLEKIDTYVF